MLAIIVPYRNRPDHLAQFIPHMNKFLPEAKIIVVEQADNKEFNRGKLLNVGVKELEADTDYYYCFHDVDKLPIKGNYSYPDTPRQIAPNPHQTYSYFGGVTLFNKKDFVNVDGFINTFWGWGGEDNELMFQVYNKGIHARWEFGQFIDLPHPRPSKEFDLARWKLSQKMRIVKNGLSTVDYQLISKEVYDTHVHLKVTL